MNKVLKVQGREFGSCRERDNIDNSSFHGTNIDLRVNRRILEIPEKPNTLRSSIDFDESEFSHHSSHHKDAEIELVKRHPPFTVKKASATITKPVNSHFVSHLLTPEKQIKKMSMNSKKVPKTTKSAIKNRLTQRIRNSTINPEKMKATSDYWKAKSEHKTKEKLEIARNSAAFFYKNKHNVEEALGGNEAQIYRQTMYGLFQIDKNFKSKHSNRLNQ